MRLTRRELTGDHHRRRGAQRRPIVLRLLPAAARLIEAKLVLTHAGNDGPITEDRGAGDGSRRSCAGAAVSAESNLLSQSQPYDGMSGHCRTQQGFPAAAKWAVADTARHGEQGSFATDAVRGWGFLGDASLEIGGRCVLAIARPALDGSRPGWP